MSENIRGTSKEHPIILFMPRVARASLQTSNLRFLCSSIVPDSASQSRNGTGIVVFSRAWIVCFITPAFLKLGEVYIFTMKIITVRNVFMTMNKVNQLARLSPVYRVYFGGSFSMVHLSRCSIEEVHHVFIDLAEPSLTFC